MKFWRVFTIGSVAAIALSAHMALAQDMPDTEAEVSASEETGGSGDLPLGQPESAVPRIYVDQVFGDWEKRCVRIENQDDACQLFQVLRDETGNPVAEFTLAPLPEPEGEAVAGGTIITPLETLLTGQLRLVVDQGETKIYPFRFCREIGCYARLGFTAADIADLKRGNVARVSIVPLQAPDQVVTLDASLSGFTAGYDSLAEAN